MTSETRDLTYDEYDDLLQGGWRRDETGPLTETEHGQWAAGRYVLNDGRVVYVREDGTGQLVDTHAINERVSREREALVAPALETLGDREVTFVTQEWVTWTVRSGRVVRVEADLSYPDGEFVESVRVEGCANHWSEGLEEYQDEDGNEVRVEDLPAGEEDLLVAGQTLVTWARLPAGDAERAVR